MDSNQSLYNHYAFKLFETLDDIFLKTEAGEIYLDEHNAGILFNRAFGLLGKMRITARYGEHYNSDPKREFPYLVSTEGNC